MTKHRQQRTKFKVKETVWIWSQICSSLLQHEGHLGSPHMSHHSALTWVLVIKYCSFSLLVESCVLFKVKCDYRTCFGQCMWTEVLCHCWEETLGASVPSPVSSKCFWEGVRVSRNWAATYFLAFHGQPWELSWHLWACHSANVLHWAIMKLKIHWKSNLPSSWT